jgi:hypothetical protein
MIERKITVLWFSGNGGTTGIVRSEISNEKPKYYIGTSRGVDEQTDIQQILDWGCKFPFEVGEVLFK